MQLFLYWPFTATAVKDAIPIIAVYDRVKAAGVCENYLYDASNDLIDW